MPRIKYYPPLRLGAVDYLANLDQTHVVLRRTCCGKFERHHRDQLARAAKSKTEQCWHCYLVSQHCADRLKAHRPLDRKPEPAELVCNGDASLWHWLLAHPLSQEGRIETC